MNRLKLNLAVALGLLCLAAAAYALPAAAGTASSQAAKATVVTVTAGKPSEFKFTLSAKSVKTGAVTFKVTNKGALGHTFKVCSSSKGGSANSCAGKGTATIAPGASATLSVTFAKAGSYEYLCTVPGHAAAGMKGDLKVT
jgi:uncharacterized cupredoxin-like copper-binding protein